MGKIAEGVIDGIDSFIAWLSTSLKQTTASYCELQTADSATTLVANDGSLVSILRLRGNKALVGVEEFNRIQAGMLQSLRTTLSKPGYSIQVHFNYNRETVADEIRNIYKPAVATAKEINLDLGDVFEERVRCLSEYCAHEMVHMVLWTRPSSMTSEQNKRAAKEKQRVIKDQKIPPFTETQNILAAIPDLRNVHDSFVRSITNDMEMLGMVCNLLEVHEALHAVRMTVDPEFTDRDWRPALPGDKIPALKPAGQPTGEISDILWPSLARQLLPRDAENIDLRTTRIGDRIYSAIFIDLFPKDIQRFIQLFARTLQTRIPWRMSFMVDGGGLSSLRIKSSLASVLAFSSAQNRLINDSTNLLNYIDLNTDDAVVKLRVSAATWAPEGDIRMLRTRTSQLAKAIEGWGSCEVSEVSGDPFAGIVSSMLGVSSKSVAQPSVASLTDVIYMLPLFRPSSPWRNGALLFRSPDGKPWPYQPGSARQTTWIDLVFARPGSGKSVLSNAINLALCLSPSLTRLPRIAVVDIGPSSSGLISLLREALPPERRYEVAYHRLRMTPEFSINPFDTQLGARRPMPQERSFLVNFLILLATPVGAKNAYDGVADMAGMVVDELYKNLMDDANPHTYTAGVEELIDGILEEINFVVDPRTTWWEVTDALFMAGFVHEAMIAQRRAVPLLADATSICRTSAIKDLYGNIKAPTGESLIDAFNRMISGAIREYPILSRPTQFDIGDAKVVSLDLDEVAKGGGDAGSRQTAVMYMLARYVLAKDYYLTEENLGDLPDSYRNYHGTRISEIREDPKRIVFDEFHRTSNIQAVRDQVVQDMREGRKWKVQVALLSQSLDDFDPIMVEFGTSIFIMDAGPEQAIKKTASVFGLSDTATHALRHRVHGPREGGATFLAQFATKEGVNTQLLTCTLGSAELWAFSTTAEDANVRNQLYRKIGPVETRKVLSALFPGGSVTRELEDRMVKVREDQGIIDEESKLSLIDELVNDILEAYTKDPNVRRLV